MQGRGACEAMTASALINPYLRSSAVSFACLSAAAFNAVKRPMKTDGRGYTPMPCRPGRNTVVGRNDSNVRRTMNRTAVHLGRP